MVWGLRSLLGSEFQHQPPSMILVPYALFKLDLMVTRGHLGLAAFGLRLLGVASLKGGLGNPPRNKP